MQPLFHRLEVSSVSADTAEAVVVGFALPEALRSTFAFTQGQYLTLRKHLAGTELRRAYSICAGIDDGVLRVGVRKVAGGVFSNWINTVLRAGDTIDVMAPQGRFFVALQPGAARHHVGIAGGSGITPILSIVKTVLVRERLSRCTLLYGNRTLRSTMFKEELDDLKNRHMARLALHHVFSDEPGDSPLAGGVLDRATVARYLQQLVPAAGISHAYICGPYQMNDEAQAALRDAGVADERIHIERFGLPSAAGGARAPGAVLHETAPGDARQSRITIVRDGSTRSFDYRGEQPSILDCAAAAGLELPFSCTSGVCGTCRVRVVEGRVRMERNFALAADDVAAGFVLACQAHPLTERLVLSFDER